MLSEASLSKKGYFHPPAVHDLLTRHRAGEHDCETHLLGILAIQLWDELFINGQVNEPPT